VNKERFRTSFITSRPVAILMVFLAAVVFGWLSFDRLPVTLMPELTYPTITVRTEYPGAAPEEVENDISRPIEESVGVIGGLKKLSSISRAGISDVVLEFAWDTEMSDATQSVLEKLDLVFLPEEAKRPLILHYDPSLDPVMELSLSGEGKRYEGESGLRRLRRLADLHVKKELEPIKGVAAVRVRGGLEEELHVLLEEEALRRTNISIQQVIDRLAQENINVAGGTLKEGRTEYLVRTLNEYENIEQIADTVVMTYEGRDVRIKDLGRVAWGHKEREILTRTDGGESVQIEIYKEGDANIVALAKRVNAALGEYDFEAATAEEEDDADGAVAQAGPGGQGGRGAATPDGLVARVFKEEGAKIQLVADRSLFIESSIQEVINTAILGGLLAVFILYLFLRNFQSTAIIAVSIPISLLITFAPLNLLGVSLNIMSLGGLALGIGMLVDSSIVVLESIYRCREEGDEIEMAANRGTSEVRGAVFASTLTSIAVFFPMVFVEGIAGQAFGDLGLAVVVSLLASAAVALFFVPMLSGRPGLGLSVAVGFAAALMMTWLAKASPAVFNGVMAVFGVLFLLGFLFSLFVALRGRMDSDPHTRRVMGLWQWSARQALVAGGGWPIRKTASIWNAWRSASSAPIRWARFILAPLVPLVTFVIGIGYWVAVWPFGVLARLWRAWGATGILRGVARIVVVPLAWPFVLLAGLAYWIYLAVIRFLVGSVLEWGVGKPVVMASFGVIAMGLRFYVPALGAVFRVVSWAPLKVTGSVLGALIRVYPRVIRAALAHPGLIVLIVVACFWGTWQVVKTVDSELLPEVHQGEFTVEVQLPVGTPLERTEEVVAPIEHAILTEKQHIESLILTVGYDSANSRDSDEGEHTAKFKVLLDENSRGAVAEQAVVTRLRTKFDGIPDLEARIERPVLFSSKTPIEVEIHGSDLAELKYQSDLAMVELSRLSELADVEATLKSGAPEVQIIYNRDRLARYGLNIRQVARLVRDKVQGYEATRFNMKDRRIPILVRLNLDDRETVDDIRGLIINPGADRPIRLASVAEVSLGEGPSEVRRIDARRVAVINANIAEGSLSGATERIAETLNRKIAWPGTMTFFITGQNEEWEASQRSLWVTLALSVFLVYVIMAAQFESLIHPLVIMVTIPLAFVGTVLALKLLGLALSIVVFLGMIMLAGIVVNNAIVLVDYINTLRRRGMSRDEAIVTAGSVRLRPILMTTATTVLGLLPMAIGLGEGAEIRTPMAIAVISGLISSTALTLIVIPSFYALADTLKSRMLGTATVRTDEPVSAGELPGAGSEVTP
jgi:multidrug efflux pump subunit AcrB